MTEEVIKLTDIHVQFDEQPVLTNINLELFEQRIGVIGANGSGKSTFIRLLNGLVAHNQGEISVDGLKLPKQAAQIRRKIGFTFQNPDTQIIMPTVEEDIAFGLKNLNLAADEIAKRTRAILAEYNLTEFAKKPARILSGGQKQLLALCGVLVMQPDIIILDEPTTQLDLRYRTVLAKVLKRLPQRLIVTTHDLSLLSNFDRVLVIDKGKIVCDAHPDKAISFYHDLIMQAL